MPGPSTDPAAIRTLVLDDNPEDRAAAIRVLRAALDAFVEHEITAAAAFDAALAAGAFDAVVTDYRMGWTDGVEVLRRVRARFPDVPVIMVTGTGSELIVLEAMQAGLDDYVIKGPTHLHRLPVALKNALAQRARARTARVTELRLRSLLEALDVGVYRGGPDAAIVGPNPALLRMLACDALDALAPDDRELLSLAAPERGLQQPLPVVTRGGRKLLLTSRPAADAGAGWFDAVAYDVTERREAEAAVLDAITAERNHIAGELHDGLGQTMTGVNLRLAALERRLGAEHPELGEIERIRRAVTEALATCRALAHRYAALKVGGGLDEALRDLAELLRESGIACRCYVEPAASAALTDTVAHELYRIAQEATTNVMRHARAASVQLSLERLDRTGVLLTIADDGCGIPRAVTSGLGLRTMRYRAERIGASMLIAPGVPGTCIQVAVGPGGRTVGPPGRGSTACGIA